MDYSLLIRYNQDSSCPYKERNNEYMLSYTLNIEMFISFQKARYADISTLVVDDKSLPVLHELGVGELCPKVRNLSLEYQRAVNLNIYELASSMFPHVSHLGISGSRDFWVKLDNVLAFCTKVATSYPRLSSLSLTDLELGNKTAEEIIGYLRHQDHLTSLV